MHERFGTTPAILAAAALTLITGLSALAPIASAGLSSPNPSAPPESWAYGAQHWWNASAQGSMGEYHVAAFFGWTLVDTLTNTSNSSFQLESQRTVAVRYAAGLCAPSCAAARATMNLSILGWENETAFANFTTNASVVTGNGTAVPALGLLDTHAVAAGALHENLSGGRVSLGFARSARLDVTGSARSQLTFGTPLGLVPWNLTRGLEWNSSAPYSASGFYSILAQWTVLGPNGTANGTLNPSAGVNGSGTIFLRGVALGNITLANGLSTSVVALAWGSGSFDADEGMILVPHGFDLFRGGDSGWGLHAPGLQSVLNARLDLAVDLGHHRVLEAAAASSYEGSDEMSPDNPSPGVGMAQPADGSPSTPSVVQAQPMSVASAERTSQCLTGRCAAGSGTASYGSLVPVLAIGGLLAAVVATVGLVEYRIHSRRREQVRGPPNQPGAAGSAPPFSPEGPMPPPPPPSF